MLDSKGAEGSIENQAYLRQWVGELMQIKGELEISHKFFLAAFAKWHVISPPQANKLLNKIENKFDIKIDFDLSNVDPAERVFRKWVLSDIV